MCDLLPLQISIMKVGNLIYSSEWSIRVETYVHDLLKEKLPSFRTFHNANHTWQVVRKCIEMCSFYQLSQELTASVVAAAWFHDTGYCISNQFHEDESVKIASSFLKENNIDDRVIGDVNRLILVTKLSVKPESLEEMIIRDADMYHLGSDEYAKWADLLKQEKEKEWDFKISEEQWRKDNIHFFRQHHYFTTYAIDHWTSKKAENLQKLLSE